MLEQNSIKPPHKNRATEPQKGARSGSEGPHRATMEAARYATQSISPVFVLASSFYAIVDPYAGHEPVQLAKLLLGGGAEVLQLRLKQASGREFLAKARQIASLCRGCGALFIVNDRADVALLAGADGVHLGQEDLPLEAARKLLGSSRLVGISTHSIQQAVEAERDGADYIGFGPLFAGGARNTATGQGLDLLRQVRASVKLPIVAIGAITEERLPEVLAAGADAAAIISDVVTAPDVRAKVRSIVTQCAAREAGRAGAPAGGEKTAKPPKERA